MKNTKSIWAGILIAIILAVGSYFFPKVKEVTPDELGSVGTRFPNGLVSGSGSIVAAGDFVADTNTLTVKAATNQVGVGTTTPTTQGDVVIDGSATTTLKIASSDTTKGGCIEIETVTGGVVRITVSGTTISAAAGACK